MLSLIRVMRKKLQAGEPVVLAGVVSAKGSTPRSEGSYMVVDRDGLLEGTVGGGTAEYRAIQKARQFVTNGESGSHQYVMNQSDVEDLGMICGGEILVRFVYIDPRETALIAVLQRVEEALVQERPVTMIMGLHQQKPVLLFYLNDELAGQANGADLEVIQEELAGRHLRRFALTEEMMAESITKVGRVVILGGGHCGLALANCVVPLDFSVAVLDDRPDFVAPERYLPAVHTHLVDLNHIEQTFAFGDDDYICVVTRGHRYDLIAAAQALRSNAAYIGVIGSRTKLASIYRQLKEDGFSDADIARLHAPIGLNIGAQTPEEIAISIAGQLIQVRAAREQGA